MFLSVKTLLRLLQHNRSDKSRGWNLALGVVWVGGERYFALLGWKLQISYYAVNPFVDNLYA